MAPSGSVPQPRLSAVDLAHALGLPHAPTQEQQRVIEAPLRPLLVVAGAGSGKTETMAARVVWLVANGYVEPEDVLGLTFTRKAAGELAERIASRLTALRRAGLWVPAAGEGRAALGGIPTISTYHGYAGRIVREHALLLGREADAQLLTEAATWQLAHEAVLGWDGDMASVRAAESTVTAAVVDLAAELAEHLCAPGRMAQLLEETIAQLQGVPRGQSRKRKNPAAEIIDNLRCRRAIVPIVERFEELKIRREVLDFADQMGLAARLAIAHPHIGRAERDRFSAVLLDEFQDTSHAQLELLRALFIADGEPIPVTAVGDPHQSIYGWRGASATTLASFAAAFAAPDPALQLTLRTSWRNDKVVLAAANLLADPLRGTNGPVVVPQLTARADAGAGRVRLGRYDSVEDEGRAIAEWLLTQRCENPGWSAAVLCRKRSQFLPVVEALEDHGIPHEVVGLGGLLLTPEVGDLLALLHVLADPSRGDQLMRLLTGPRTHLGVGDLDGFGAWARERQRTPREGPSSRDIAGDQTEQVSLVEALDDLPPAGWIGPNGERVSPEGAARLLELAGVVHSVRRMSGLPLADLVGEAERALGLDVEVLSRPDRALAASRAHLDAFADVAADYAVSADRPSLAGFLAWVAAAMARERGLERSRVDAGPGTVQVLTIHAAKGLEWDVVVVPGLTEGTFPAHESRATLRGGEWIVSEPTAKAWLGGLTSKGVPHGLRGDAAGLPTFRIGVARDFDTLAEELADFEQAVGQHELLEERRLAYVALTRARHRALLTAPVWSRGTTPRVTSRFLTELHTAACAGGLADAVEVGPWCAMPPTNARASMDGVAGMDGAIDWPVDRVGAQWECATAAAASIHEILDSPATPINPEERPAEARAGGAWSGWAEEIDVLLRERVEAASSGTSVAGLPAHLSTAQLLAVTDDPDRFALDLRRPIPQQPALAARRGTRFHAWVEQHYARAVFVEPDELPGSADADAADETAFPQLREAFLASEWAGRVPVELETSVETVIDGLAIRGRIDAVFRDGADWLLLDWKTGSPPTREQLPHRALQLAVYRVAWARLRRLPLDRVRAGFFFAGSGVTVWPPLPDEFELIELVRTLRSAFAAPDPT